MLTEERYTQILKLLSDKKAVTVTELTELLSTSESTIRRDLNALDRMGKLNKVYGGATLISNDYSAEESDVNDRYGLYAEEKEQIAKYAATLIRDNDFVYVDAGTSTETLVDYITAEKATFVSNSYITAYKLARRGFATFVLGGRMRGIAGAVTGSGSIDSLRRYHFTLGFFGSNAIDPRAGFSTPDVEEAMTKTEAMSRCKRCVVLADPSKFDKIMAVSFGSLNQAEIITTRLNNKQYRSLTTIREVSQK